MVVLFEKFSKILQRETNENFWSLKYEMWNLSSLIVTPFNGWNKTFLKKKKLFSHLREGTENFHVECKKMEEGQISETKIPKAKIFAFL